MRAFLKRLTVFLITVVMVNLMGNMITSDQVLEPIFSKKLNDWRDQAGSNDLLFIGSSRTYSHIDPEVIDRFLNRTALGTCYNFGMNSTFVPETYHVLEVLLNEIRIHKFPVKTIVLELQAPDAISVSNATTLKGNYWLTPRYLKVAVQLAWKTTGSIVRNSQLNDSNIGAFSKGNVGTIVKKTLMILTYLEASIFRQLGFNYLEAIDLRNYEDYPYRAGHLCLDEELDFNLDTKRLEQRQMQLNLQSENLIKRLDKRAALDSVISSDSPYNDAHLSFINGLTEACSEQGIRLLFVLMPKQSDYGEQLPLACQLQSDCIDMSDTDNYPEFWQSDYSFDIGHLNCKGSALLSRKLAVRLNEMNHRN